MPCPCGTGLELDACCGAIISGKRPAPTPEALMRSRYTAYSLKNADYILASHDPEKRADADLDATRDWAERTTWLELKIVNTTKGGPDDSDGEVEFIARFADERGREHVHHERSQFVRRDDRWYFHDGQAVAAPPVRAAPKVGRNDPCPCGSGKKHKKCCGARAA
jgi:SEC-C motif-containing protein